jgi:hypothetical protein
VAALGGLIVILLFLPWLNVLVENHALQGE